MNWFNRLFSFGDRQPHEPLSQPTKEPELSCFVKGLIRSMKETPEEWTRYERFYSGGEAWAHPALSGCIWLPAPLSRYVRLSNEKAPNLTYDESKALTDAVFVYLEEPHRSHGRREFVAHFVSLGCPDKTT